MSFEDMVADMGMCDHTLLDAICSRRIEIKNLRGEQMAALNSFIAA
jgi:hypothetical protein